MKPNFALNLSDDRIGLLQRTGRGWLPLGEALFGAPDMEDRLTALREKAAHATPRGIATKLVIPNSQILYTTVTVTAATDSGKTDEIRAALAGRTPYAVEDLAFDWCGDGPEVKVAVVARETLEQAESFAVDHAFRPISFVAIPEAEAFDGEPMFGATVFSIRALGKGRRLERDLVPIRIIGGDAAAAVAAEDVLPPEEEEDDAPEMVADAALAEPEPDAPALTTAEIFPETDAEVAEEPPVEERVAETPVAAAETPPPEVAADPVPPPAPRFTIAAVTDPATSVVSPQVPDVADEAPFQDVSDQTADATAADDDLPPAPSTAALMAFASRRAADGGAKPLGAPPPRGSAAPMPGLLADRLAARAESSVTPSAAAFVTEPSLPGGKKRKPLANGGTAAAMPLPDMPRKPLTKPGGTFASTPPVRGKPRFLGLILTGILILFLALVAAWSSFFLASNGADDETGTAVAVAEPDVPLVDDEMLADGQVPDDVIPADDIPADDVAVADVPEPGPDPAAPAPDAIAATETAGPAPETGVDASGAGVTGPAEVAPDAGGDEIFLSRADAPLVPAAPAEIAAPAPVDDTLPAAQLPPPPFGTVYAFNPNGTIQATPEGIMTPEGVRLVAGPPAVLPRVRPAAVAAAIPAPVVPETLPAIPETLPAVDDTTAVGSDPALADARPRSRPANLVVPETDDDAALQGVQPIPANATRPRSRPETILAAGEEARLASEAASLAAASAAAGSAAEAAILGLAAEEPAGAVTPSGSRLALSVSRIPAPRPRDLERAVAAALAAATRAPDPEPEPEPEPRQAAAASTAAEADDEPELASAAPSAPISGSVADQATFVNAINLSRVNLIGIYGSQSDRRALIRQGNGRYKTVEVGDRVDGGTIAAITATEVRYQKGGRLIALQMPDT